MNISFLVANDTAEIQDLLRQMTNESLSQKCKDDWIHPTQVRHPISTTIAWTSKAAKTKAD